MRTAPSRLARLFIFALLTATFIFAVPVESFAAKITRVKGKTIYIKLEGEKVKAGDIFYVMRSRRKRSGVVKVTRVRGRRVTGVLNKRGKAKVGWSLKHRPKRKRYSKRSRRQKGSTSASKSTAFWGVVGGFALDNMDVQLNTSTTTSMSGNGFSLKGLFDYAVFSQIWFRALVGYEGFSASSTDTICGTGSNEQCSVALGYLSGDLWGRFVFSQGTMRPWVGGGFNLMFPLVKTTTAVQEASIANTSVIALGGGLDWFLSKTMYIPIQVEYGIFPSSENVSATSISLRAGAAWEF